MIQWLQSKMVLIAAGIILISSLTGVFYYQMEQIEREERSNRCNKISQVIDDLYSSNNDVMRQRITFDPDSEGIYLSPEVRGDPFTLKIRTGHVEVEQDGDSSIKRLNVGIHLWDHDSINETGYLNRTEERWRDRKTSSLELRSGEGDLKLIMMKLDDGSAVRKHIFISEVEST